LDAGIEICEATFDLRGPCFVYALIALAFEALDEKAGQIGAILLGQLRGLLEQVAHSAHAWQRTTTALG